MASIITERAFVCTPASLINSTPCLKCLSEKELLAAIVGIVANNTGKTIPEIMQAGACFTCLSKKQMLQAWVSILGNALLGEGTSPADVIADIRCLECASEQQLLAAILYQFCTAFTITGD